MIRALATAVVTGITAIVLYFPAPREAPLPAVPPDLKPPFTFALLGDVRSGHDIHRSILAQIDRTDSHFLVLTGDLTMEMDDDEDFKTWLEISKDVRARLPYYTAKGNHDDGVKGRFERSFRLPAPYFDRVTGPIHFFFLDSTEWTQGQIDWLRQTAASSASPHRIAVMHHTPFTMMASRDSAAARMRERVHPLLRELRFTAAFCGHDHHFYTTVRDGIRYVITGGGGAVLYDIDEQRAMPGDLFRKFHHYLLVQVSESSITARVFDLAGTEDPSLAFAIWEK